MDRLYIPTRYPNGLPDITPDMAYSEDDSHDSIETAKKIINQIETIILLEKEGDGGETPTQEDEKVPDKKISK